MAISDHDRKLLWGQSGFQCAICKVQLAADPTALDRHSLIGEECHIVSRSPDGPRGQFRDGIEIDSYANHILLCRNHHKQIDDQTNTFTVETLLLAKAAHIALVKAALQPDVANDDPPDEENELPSGFIRDDPLSGSSVVLDSFEKTAFLPSGMDDDEIFAWRISDAFPGKRGLVVIDNPREALDRLDVVLRHPIETLARDDAGRTWAQHPFYWYRGYSNMEVNRYACLDEEHCLINDRELWISRIAAYRSSSSPHQFLYIESQAEQPIGIYQYEAGEIEAGIERGRYYEESYGLWQDRVITASEYEDRAAIIDGKPVAMKGAQLRSRFLTSYNMILCCRHHVMNPTKYDVPFQKLLDGILHGDTTLEELCAYMKDLPVPSRMGRWS